MVTSQLKAQHALVVAVGLMSVALLQAVSPEAAADGLRPEATASIVSAKSGPWSQAATWIGGKVPGAGTRVRIAAPADGSLTARATDQAGNTEMPGHRLQAKGGQASTARRCGSEIPSSEKRT